MTANAPHADPGLSADELSRLAEVLVSAGTPVAGALTADLITGGRSNLTYRLTDGRSRWVLRTPPRAGRTPSAHDIVREYRVTSALAGTAVPVAPAIVLCEDESLIGGPFAVWGFVDGRTVRTQRDLAEVDAPALATTIAALVAALASLHQVDYANMALSRLGRPDAYAARQLKRWRGQWELVAPPGSASAGAKLGEELAARVPDQPATGVVHGDFRIDNTILGLDPRSQPRVAAVVDWELSTIGDPVADVAMMAAYRHPVFDLIVGEPSSWTSGRLPTVEALAAAYEAAGGVPLVAWDFHLALAYFKIGVIAAGIDHRRRAGAASGPGFDTGGEAVATYLDLGFARLKAARRSRDADVQVADEHEDRAAGVLGADAD